MCREAAPGLFCREAAPGLICKGGAPASHPRLYPTKLTQNPIEVATSKITIHWQDLTDIPFTEPFFEDTLRLANPTAHHTTTWPDPSITSHDFISPTGFIFHASRSGSTLLTQLLTCLDHCIAISEPPIIDEVLQSRLPTPDKISLLRDMIQALAQRRSIHDRCC
jgi:hypothetical protein